ncbi:thioredoxin family protein [Bacillus testis]|uniref:thioredoxin family protein n=1 Tax=Bacillus testis TaxID=1622072 RepID=UPI00067E7729|nr:thioredoxin family protein [Bacillus testis]
MKKIIIFLAGIIVLFAAIFLVTNMSKDQKKSENASKSAKSLYDGKDLKQETIDQLDDPNYQNIILPEDLEKKLANEQQTFVYFFSPTCPHCIKATPKMMKAAKAEGVHINQFNLWEFEDGWDKYHIESTPTLIVYNKGKEVDRLNGDTSQKTFASFIKQYKQ